MHIRHLILYIYMKLMFFDLLKIKFHKGTTEGIYFKLFTSFLDL